MAQSSTPSATQRIMQHGQPTVRARFAQPVILKQASVFLLCTEDGDIRADSDQGLYFHDMRYLSEQTLRLNGMPGVSLLADAGEGWIGVFQLSNSDLKDENGAVCVRKEALGIRREKRLQDDFGETISVQNYTAEPVALALELRYQADFADMFVVRGRDPGKRGTLHEPEWHGATLRFRYDGADGHERTTSLQFSPKPDEHDGGRIVYRLSLGAHERWELTVICALRDNQQDALGSRPSQSKGSQPEDRERARQGALGTGTRVETNNPLFNDILTRSFMDIHMLRMHEQGHSFLAAGVPWYVALFGRDTLVTSFEVAAFASDIAADALRVLASFQGDKEVDERDEQPGKIPHEFRIDEMANLREIPQTPYYGSVDSTPLFLVLLGAYTDWSGSLDLFHELRGNVDRALAWIDRYGDSDGDGFIDYQTHSTQGARNQGWKDSGNGIVMENGSLAEPPIALPEVQGDVYRAWLSIAELLEQDDAAEAARTLRERAKRLYDAFNDQFWLRHERYYAFCREAGGRFSKSIASNPAHALWTGIVDPKRAPDVAARVLQPDMFSGWGVRTLSAGDQSYNPVDYQVGSVWPHDNAMIVAGLHRYSLGDEALRVFTSLKDAAARFDHYRLPEVFAGYERSLASRPVTYPVACNPQAWAAGSIPLMLASVLGLHADGLHRRLRIKQPRLPDWLRWLNVRDLSVAGASVDLHYERSDAGTLVNVERKDGDLEVLVEY